MRRWLARLGFSFIILAAVFAWEGYKLTTHEPTRPQRSYYYFAAAGAFAVMGLLGIRERHRMDG